MLTFISQCYPIQKVVENIAMVLFFIWKVESHPTHADNFSHEGKKEGKLRLAYEVKTNF